MDKQGVVELTTDEAQAIANLLHWALWHRERSSMYANSKGNEAYRRYQDLLDERARAVRGDSNA